MWQKNTSGFDLITADDSQKKNDNPRDPKYDIKLDEKDHPSSLEPQLLFHRAGSYLTIACQHIHIALDGLESENRANGSSGTADDGLSQAQKDALRQRVEARKIVKANAKRALRDYISFLSHLDYTPGLPIEITEEFLRKVNAAANGYTKPRPTHSNRLLDMATQSTQKSNNKKTRMAMSTQRLIPLFLHRRFITCRPCSRLFRHLIYRPTLLNLWPS
jgi:hypothetical protein